MKKLVGMLVVAVLLLCSASTGILAQDLYYDCHQDDCGDAFTEDIGALAGCVIHSWSSWKRVGSVTYTYENLSTCSASFKEERSCSKYGKVESKGPEADRCSRLAALQRQPTLCELQEGCGQCPLTDMSRLDAHTRKRPPEYPAALICT